MRGRVTFSGFSEYFSCISGHWLDMRELFAEGNCRDETQRTGLAMDLRIECWFGVDPDGSVPFEQWSVWITPSEESGPCCRDAGGYGDAARIVRELSSYGLAEYVAEGPFPVGYYRLGSGAPRMGVAPVGVTFRTRHGAALEYASVG